MRSRDVVLQLENERSHQNRPLTKLQAPPPLPPTIAPHNPLHNLPHQQIKASPYCLFNLQQISWFILMFGWLILAEKFEISGLVRAGTEKKEGRKRNRKREKGEGRRKGTIRPAPYRFTLTRYPLPHDPDAVSSLPRG